MKKIIFVLLSAMLFVLSACVQADEQSGDISADVSCEQSAEETSEVSEAVISATQVTVKRSIGYDTQWDYTFDNDKSVALIQLLIDLDYDPQKVCLCLPVYTVTTQSGEYGFMLSEEGYARTEKGQASLSEEQVRLLGNIVDWIEKEIGVEA